MSSTRHVLMCEPRHYRIAYEINPWMRRSNAVVGRRAAAQWGHLRRLLIDLGVQVDLIEQAPEAPDMVFTANAGVVSDGLFLSANFRHSERRPETPHLEQWFRDRGYAIDRVPESHRWEGEGDVLESEGRVFAAEGIRTDREALDEVDRFLRTRSVRLELTDPYFYHLDTCLFAVDEKCALYFPPAFTLRSRMVLAKAFPDLIEVPRDEAYRFACNALRIGRTVVMNAGTEGMAAALEERGYRCLATPTDEFVKAGGSVKCMTLTLDTFHRP